MITESFIALDFKIVAVGLAASAVYCVIQSNKQTEHVSSQSAGQPSILDDSEFGTVTGKLSGEVSVDGSPHTFQDDQIYSLRT